RPPPDRRAAPQAVWGERPGPEARRPHAVHRPGAGPRALSISIALALRPRLAPADARDSEGGDGSRVRDRAMGRLRAPLSLRVRGRSQAVALPRFRLFVPNGT